MAKLRGELEKANRKAEDQDFAIQKIDAKIATFDELYKKLAGFVSLSTFYPRVVYRKIRCH